MVQAVVVGLIAFVAIFGAPFSASLPRVLCPSIT